MFLLFDYGCDPSVPRAEAVKWARESGVVASDGRASPAPYARGTVRGAIRRDDGRGGIAAGSKRF